jgi:uncharacterized SAM-binding protein YcdF (DUF218 family)
LRVETSTTLLFLTKFATWLSFPLSLAGLALLATVLWPGIPRRPRALCALALVILWGGGSRIVSERFAGALENRSTPLSMSEAPADAIVVLGGGIMPATPPRRSPELSDAGDRVFEAARLWREGRAPLVVACGGSLDGAPPEASDIAALLRFLGVAPSAILEDLRSRTTRENAVEARNLLDPLGGKRILLVTSALHMPRAAALFRGQGFEVVPAPTDWLIVAGGPRSRIGTALSLLPNVESLSITTRALREWLGLAVASALGWLA